MTPVQLQTKLDALGLSQRAFANLICTNERSVRRWIAGERRVPPWIPVILKLLEKLRAAGLS